MEYNAIKICLHALYNNNNNNYNYNSTTVILIHSKLCFLFYIKITKERGNKTFFFKKAS